MTVRGKIHLLDDEDKVEMYKGVPLCEQALEIELGPCVSCGAEPGEEGALMNSYVKGGVMRGETVCGDCLTILFPEVPML